MIMEQVARKLTFSKERSGSYRPRTKTGGRVTRECYAYDQTATGEFHEVPGWRKGLCVSDSLERDPARTGDAIAQSLDSSKVDTMPAASTEGHRSHRFVASAISDDSEVMEAEPKASVHEHRQSTPSFERLLEELDRELGVSALDNPFSFKARTCSEKADEPSVRGSQSSATSGTVHGSSRPSSLETGHFSPLTGQRSRQALNASSQRSKTIPGSHSPLRPAVSPEHAMVHRTRRIWPPLDELEAMVSAGRQALISTGVEHRSSTSHLHAWDKTEDVGQLRAELENLRMERDTLQRTCAAKERTNMRLRQRLGYLREQLNALVTELHAEHKISTEKNVSLEPSPGIE